MTDRRRPAPLDTTPALAAAAIAAFVLLALGWAVLNLLGALS